MSDSTNNNLKIPGWVRLAVGSLCVLSALGLYIIFDNAKGNMTKRVSSGYISKDALPGEAFIYDGTCKNRRAVVFEGDGSMRMVISDGEKTEQYTGLVGEQAGLAEKQIIKTAALFVGGEPVRPQDVAGVLTNVTKTCNL